MKNIMIILLLIFSSCRTQSQVIGEIVNGQPKFSVNVSQMIQNFTRNLKEASQIDGEFQSVQILAGEDSSDAPYFLLFKGPVYSSVIACRTQESDGKVLIIAMATTSCTTSDFDCSQSGSDCWPTLFSGCTPCSNGGKCTRTSSTFSLLARNK